MNSRKLSPNGLKAQWCRLKQRRSWRQDKNYHTVEEKKYKVRKKKKGNDKMMKEYTKEKMIMMNTEGNEIRCK
jgi:hypothetical protein